MSGWSADFSPRVPGRRNYPICGFAPGDYVGRCRECGKHFFGDKRAWHCEPCAVPMHDRWVAAEKTPGSVAVILGELWFIERIEGNLIHGEIVE